mmetsp:Transcript_46948/g.100452  ORF Transcript_46948/g.100452 Transcript_46948/m.100452 type:complete len:228 (-) Transcript_46948:199-882(-)
MYFWQIHWPPSLCVAAEISSSSRSICMPRPRDFPEGFTIQAFRLPLIWNCLLFASMLCNISLACSINFSPRDVWKLGIKAKRGTVSPCFFSPSSAGDGLHLRPQDLPLGDMRSFFLMKSANSSSSSQLCKGIDTSSRFTCRKTAHSSSDTAKRLSASSGASMTSSTSVTTREHTSDATRKTSWLKVNSTAAAMWRRNSRNTASAFVNLKSITKLALSEGSTRSKARG